MKNIRFLFAIVVFIILISVGSTFFVMSNFQQKASPVQYPLIIRTEADYLGDQMFLAAAQISYAKKFKRNVCWEIPTKVLFPIPVRPCSRMEMSALLIKPCFFDLYSKNFNKQADCSVLTGGTYQDERFFKSDKKFIEKAYMPPAPNPMSEIVQKMEEENSVAVYVKRGDYIQKHLPILPISYYDKAIDYVAKKAGKDIKLFVFTDDKEWVEKHFPKKYPIEIVVNNSEQLDLFMMTKCHNIILGNVSTAWWGAYLNQNKNKVVVFPDEGNFENKRFSKNMKRFDWKSISTKPLPGGRIGIIYIATGRYIFFWDRFYERMEKYFVPELPKDYYIFTDNTKKVFPKNAHRIYQEQEPWPKPTFNRYHYMNSIRDTLIKYDWLYFLNANADPQKYIGGEVIPNKEQKLVFARHPIYYGWTNKTLFQFERDPASAAYIPLEDGYTYIIGGLNGGQSKDYLEMTKILEERINFDMKRGITPIWHDESHINRYHTEYVLAGNKPLTLTPTYTMFEELMTTKEFPDMHKFRKDPHLIFIDKQKLGGRTWFRQIDNVNTVPPASKNVSVIIPTYNMAKTLPKAIDSIIAQTYKDWEIIVINDGSTDNTMEVLKKYAGNPQIRVINNEKNMGLAASLNKGLMSASGKYIARLDADDTSYPDRLQRQVDLMENKKLDFLAAECDESLKKHPKREDDFDSYSIGLGLLMHNIIYHTTVMMRKSFLVDHNLFYNGSYRNAEDYHLWVKFFMLGGKMAYMGGNPVTNYNRTYHSKEWWRISIYNAMRAKKEALSSIIPDYNDNMLRLHICELMPKMIEGNKKTKVLNTHELKRFDKKYCHNK